MEYILVGALAITCLAWGFIAGFKRGKKENGFFDGYDQGKRDAAKEIFKALGVRDGYEIESVSFRKSRK